MYSARYACTYVMCTHIRICVYKYVQLLQEFIGVWRWTIYQRWGVYSLDTNTDSTGKVCKPSAIQHQIMTKVHMYLCYRVNTYSIKLDMFTSEVHETLANIFILPFSFCLNDSKL